MKIALWQAAGTPARPDLNRRLMAQAAQRAAALGCGLIVFPELFASGYNIGDAVFELAEPAQGPTAETLARAARSAGIAILAGYPERSGERVYNSAMLISPRGEPLANARKTHLFGSQEKRLFTPGDALTMATLDEIRIGILICYDVEFPEAVRALAVNGAQLVAVPTALMRPYQRIAGQLVPMRAFENQIFVAYANRCGSEADLGYCGASCIVAPDGGDLARAGVDETLISAEIDPGAWSSYREHYPYLADRRPELYRARLDAPDVGDRQAASGQAPR